MTEKDDVSNQIPNIAGNNLQMLSIEQNHNIVTDKSTDRIKRTY